MLPELSSSCGEQGLLSSWDARTSLAVEHGLQGAWASVVAVPRLESTGSIVTACRPSCSMVCGIFPDQGSNSGLWYWQADSLPLSHQGSLILFFLC